MKKRLQRDKMQCSQPMGRKIANALGFLVDRGNTWASSAGQSHSRHVDGSLAPKAPSIAMCQVHSRFSAKGAFHFWSIAFAPCSWKFSAKRAFNRNVPGPWRFSAEGAFHVSLGQRPRILVKKFTSAESAIQICRSSRKLIPSPR